MAKTARMAAKATTATRVKGDDGTPGAPGQDGNDAIFRLPSNGRAIQTLSSFKTGAFDESASEVVAFHPESRRVFVINAMLGQVQILKLSALGQLAETDELLDPAVDITDGFVGGGVNSVAVSGDLVAVAVQNDTTVLAGKVAFYDANSLEFLSAVDVGSLPDMVAFTPDGTKVLVANEAEQQRDGSDDIEIDPVGGVSVIDVSGGVMSATVANIDFTGIDARLEEFRAKGVRYIPGALASGSSETDPRALSDDLEPEYIAINGAGTQAFVTLQENNAFAVIDLSGDTPTLADIRPLGLKDWSRDLPVLTNYEIPDSARPSLGTLDTTADAAAPLLLGGLSALTFEEEAGDVYSFLTVPDRGPQIDPADLNASHDGNERPHVMGNTYQAKIYRYSFDADAEEFTGMPDEIPLFSNTSGCDPVRGVANDSLLDAGEFAVDLSGNPIDFRPLDGDFEGLAIDPDGDGYWLVDEYRPAIYFFSLETTGCLSGDHGLMQYRLVPSGTKAASSTGSNVLSVWDGALDEAGETLPGRYLNRRPNRGFEAVAIDPANEILYAFIQSPLDVASAARGLDVIRILAVDIEDGSGTFGQPVSEYLYFLEGSDVGSRADKIGDAVFDPATGKILVIERDSSFGSLGNKDVFEIDLRGATNTLADSDEYELMEVDTIIAAGVNPVFKRKVMNLSAAGYVAGDKPEGLALITEGDLAGSLALINDNDFGLEPTLDGNKKVELSTEFNIPTLSLVTFSQANGLDASDRDDAINITHHPIFGMYMPDSVASYDVDGRSYYLTANEGDSRDYDEARVKDEDGGSKLLDAFFGTVSDNDFGRIKFSVLDGDTDYDGKIEQINTYGARSMSIWDELGNLVWDSGSMIEEITASAYPNDFNSTNDENMSFDNRSDDKGPEPEGITVGQIGDKWFAFVGLERMGGIMIFDVTNPMAPAYVDYVNHRYFAGSVAYGLASDLGPEGLEFISAGDSPTGMPLLLVGNEVSGTTTVFQIDL